jgi:hypothetical protein
VLYLLVLSKIESNKKQTYDNEYIFLVQLGLLSLQQIRNPTYRIGALICFEEVSNNRNMKLHILGLQNLT